MFSYMHLLPNRVGLGGTCPISEQGPFPDQSRAKALRGSEIAYLPVVWLLLKNRKDRATAGCYGTSGRVIT
jgi:hypothetical protein